ncbi:MAG: hypothetical protein GY720_21770 [bacterium]|nr:hypothetical protein [bacterium]
MGNTHKFRIFVIAALAASTLAATSGTALADSDRSDDDDDRSNGVVHLDERFDGWFSNGMSNEASACGPFAESADAVVWHLYLDVPDEVDAEDLTKVQVQFGGAVDVETRYDVADGRVNVWARTSVKQTGNGKYARQGAHTSIKKAQVHVADKEVRLGKDAAIQLGNVCYSGLGPIGEITIYLQGLVCDGYDRFAGNQVVDSSTRWDLTGGDWQLWDQVYKNNAPTVKVVGKTKGCTFENNQQFAVGTSAGMANRTVLPGTTDAADNGLLKISSADLPAEHRKALFWVNEQLWFERLDNHELGAFQCYDDRLHADNAEWILIRDYDKLPSTITCIAWNVTAAAARNNS